MNLIKPKKLNDGDTIGLLSAAGAVEDAALVESAREYFERRGFKVVVSSNFDKRLDYLSGTDKERIEAIEASFTDDNIDAIVCLRGGFGALRVINSLNYDLVRENPKIFVGYSDISAFLAMFCKKAGLLTFHGAMALSDFSGSVSAFTESLFFDMLQTSIEERIIIPTSAEAFYNGVAKGILWGGNLSTIASLAGSDFVPDEEFVFFTEDINEPTYKIDRLFTQLLNIEKFRKNLKGIALGEFTACPDPDILVRYLKRLAQQLQIPILSGFKISHGTDKIILPVGVKCSINTENSSLTILESCFNG